MKTNILPEVSIQLATRKGFELVPINTIIRIEAISNYSKLFFINGNTLVVAKVLKWFDEALAERGFIRIHRSHLVNRSCIKAFRKRTERIILKNNDEVDLARRRKTHFLNNLSKIAAA
jgi:two-component system, LytTR family, response regulator